MELKSKKTTYEFSPDDIKNLISKELNVEPEKVKVRFVITEVGGDYMDRYRGTDTVTSIEVTVGG